MLTMEFDKKALLKLARDSLTSFFKDEKPEIKVKGPKRGVFVTLHEKGELRGCIGFPHPTHSLQEAIVEATREAAFGDPRFPPVTEPEIKKLKIEISVLTEPMLIHVKKPDEYLKKITIGKDGLIIKGTSSGLLLPQVPVEWKWNVTEFLNALCEKAGLHHTAWQDLDNKIYAFQAEVFSE